MAEPHVSAESSPVSSAACGRCGARLSDGLAGNCPACLASLALGFDTGPGPEPERPRRLGGYELLGEIARGGFGVVYRARQAGLNRHVALKVLLGGEFASGDARRRFFLEAEAVARLQHPGIVAIHEVGEHDGVPFFAMELVEGRSLAQEVARQPLAPRLAARMIQQVAEAVDYAHSRGVIHRDLKPSNILLDELGRPRVTDFGLARRLESQTQLTRSDEMLGSPSYLPPERLRAAEAGGARGGVADRRAPGEVDAWPGGDPRVGLANGASPCPPEGVAGVLPREGRGEARTAGRPSEPGGGSEPARGEPTSDIYSLGATLYHLLTGRAPFVGDSVHAVLAQVERADPVGPRRLNPAVPRDLETICLRCLEKEPGRRYATARELAEDLGRLLRNEPIRARPPGLLGQAWRWCRRQPVVAGLLGLLCASLFGGGLAVTALWQQAEHARQRSDLEAYAADLRLASQALNEGDLGRARRLLEGHRSERPDFAWRLLWHRCRGDHEDVVGSHAWIVSSVAWSPDGRWLVSGGIGSGTVAGETKLWDLEATPPVGVVLGPAARQVAWPSRGGRFLAAHQDGRVRVWDAATRRVVRELDAMSVAASSDGSRVVLGDVSPIWWEVVTPRPMRLWLPETDEMRELPPGNHAAVSPDGQWAAVADFMGGLTVCTLPDGGNRRALTGAGRAWAMAFSPDNRWLVVSGVEADLRVFDLQGSESTPRRLSGHALGTWGIAFSPDGRDLVTTSSDRTLRFWRVGTWEPWAIQRGHGDETWCVAFRSDGSRLASGGKDHQVLRWSPPARAAAPEFPLGPFERPHLSRDGRWLASHPGGTNGFSELPGGRRHPGGGGTLVGFASEPDNAWSWRGGFRMTRVSVAAARAGGDPDRGDVVLGHEDGEPSLEFLVTGAGGTRAAGWQAGRGISVWELSRGRRLQGPLLRDFQPVHLALSEDARWLVAVAGEAGGRLVDLVAGTVRGLTNHLDQMKDAVFSPDGRWLATASVDSTIKLWDPRTGEERATLRGHLTQVDSVAFASDGTTLASVEDGLGLRLWHLPTRRELAAIPLPEAGGWLGYVPGDQFLAVRRTGGGLMLVPASRESE